MSDTTYRKKWNELLKKKLHIQKLEHERDVAQQESTKLKEKVRSLSQRIGDEWRAFREEIN
jgi:hypothetical protein